MTSQGANQFGLQAGANLDAKAGAVGTFEARGEAVIEGGLMRIN